MPVAHPFVRAPHRTVMSLSVPVLVSLVAEPLTGLVDTAFVARVGADALAALGVGAMVLSSVFWVFNFLAIGSQTEVAQAVGRGRAGEARQISGVGLTLSLGFGVAAILIGVGAAPWVAGAMGAEGAVHAEAVTYLRIRLLGAPALLVMVTSFGVLRGLQDMRTPLGVALGVNGLNIALDAMLVFGLGPIPAFGVAGAAGASAVSQWLGAGWAMHAVYRRLGRPAAMRLGDAARLLRIGSDLFVRIGLLTLFLLWATRAATRIGADAGAAHQAVRQVWVFNALFLDAFAITGQSLVAYFLGADNPFQARRVAGVVCAWSLGTGALLGCGMWLGTEAAARWLAPPPAEVWFTGAWLIAAASQPVNALSFGTDGIHWGAGDFRYLRNAVVAATAAGMLGLQWVDPQTSGALNHVWCCTTGWIGIRAALGVARIWPGVGRAPLKRRWGASRRPLG